MLPAFLLQHVVTVESYLGQGADGPVFDKPRQIKCMRDNSRQLVRAPSGDQVVSETRLFCNPDVVINQDDRVTLDRGRKTTVMLIKNLDTAGLTPLDHIEITLK